MLTPNLGLQFISALDQRQIHPEQITSLSKGKPHSRKPTTINPMFLFLDCVKISRVPGEHFQWHKEQLLGPEQERRKDTLLQFGVCAKH